MINNSALSSSFSSYPILIFSVSLFHVRHLWNCTIINLSIKCVKLRWEKYPACPYVDLMDSLIMVSLILADCCLPLVMPFTYEIRDLDVNRLILFVLWWYRTDAIRDLITLKWNVLALDTEKKKEIKSWNFWCCQGKFDNK